MKALLTLAAEELPDVPLFYQLPQLVKIVRTSSPPMWMMRAAILNAGYRVSIAHAGDASIKTNAPNHVIWDILRCCIRDNSGPSKSLAQDSAGAVILAAAPILQADFTRCANADVSTTARKHSGKGVRFLPNPESNWGPKARASRKRKGTGMTQQDIARAKQGKRRKKKICHAFAETSSCPRGDKCKFSHAVAPAMPSADSDSISAPETASTH